MGLLPDGDWREKRASKIADAPPPVPSPILTVGSPAGVAFAVLPIAVTTIARLRSTAAFLAHPLGPSRVMQAQSLATLLSGH